jgi:tetratricopeptide (TPR) repeat protein
VEEDILHQQAMILFDRAYRHQQKGELADAIQLYRRSLAVQPTPEAHTYLGWTFSLLRRFDAAIEQCKLAIALDPEFGNPYNDIGAYLIELGRWEEAIQWLEKATVAQSYDTPHFAFLNLGRVYEHLGRHRTALTQIDQALMMDPFYRPAIWAKFDLLAKLN